MSDFNRIFNLLSEFHKQEWNKSAAKINLRRHPIETLRVRYWLEGLRQRTAIKSAYALEQYFEEESFRRNSDGTILHYRSKWSRYEQDLVTPKSKTLKRVELLAPGSTRELEHPLWIVMRHLYGEPFDSEIIMKTLSSEIQSLVFSSGFAGLSSYSLREPVTGRLLDKLERCACLDSVACLLCLLFEAVEQQRTCVTEKIIRALHNVMLMIGIELQARCAAIPFLDLITAHVFSLGDKPYLKASMTSHDYVEASAYLNLMVYNNYQNRKRILTWRQRVRVMHQFIHGRKGMEVEFAMYPQFELRTEVGEVPVELFQKNNRDLKRRAWAWSYIYSSVLGTMSSADSDS